MFGLIFIAAFTPAHIESFARSFVAQARPTITLRFNVPTDELNLVPLLHAGLTRINDDVDMCDGWHNYVLSPTFAGIARNKRWSVVIRGRETDIVIPIGIYKYVARSASVEVLEG